MILGVGVDMVDIRRIKTILARHEARFVARIFTALEREQAERRPAQKIAYYAKRWSAKEACAKALGSGIKQGIDWRDMCVQNTSSGQPTIALSGGAGARLASITPPGHIAQVHVSLTDEYPYALGYVVISAEPA